MRPRACHEGVEVLAFIDDMAERLAACDLMICRAGAVTVSELCAGGVPAVLVPLIVSTTAHQRDNALFMAQHGAAIHLPQAELTPERLAELLQGLRPPVAAGDGREGACAGPPARGGARRRRNRIPGETAMKHAIKHIHFVGVGGSGMSGIAEILHNLGYTVSGSDQSDSPTLQRLGSLGIRVFVGHDARQIKGAGAVVDVDGGRPAATRR